jgi:hypothetical protein
MKTPAFNISSKGRHYLCARDYATANPDALIVANFNGQIKKFEEDYFENCLH